MGKPWDKLLKRMSDRFALDILRHLAGIEGVLGLEALPDEVPGRREAETESVVPDRLYRMETDHGPRVLVYEFLARYRRKTAVRMQGYANRVHDHWELPVEVVVVALDGPADPVVEVHGGGEWTVLRFRLVLAALWQMEAEAFLERHPLSLLPLAGVAGDLTPELLARGLRRILKEAKDPDRIRELVGDLILLAKRRLPTEEIQRTTRKETGMSELPMVDELLEEGREEGRLAEARRSILDILEARFEEIPADLAERLAAIDDLERLGELRREAIRGPDPASFLDRLED